MQSLEASYVCYCRLIKNRRNTLRSHCLIIVICVSGEDLVAIRTLRSSECNVEGLFRALEGLAWKDLRKIWKRVFPPYSLLTSTIREGMYSVLVTVCTFCSIQTFE